MNPDRRTVLKGLGTAGAVAAGGLVGWQWIYGGSSDPSPTTGAPPPPAASSTADALVAVGSRYLREVPEEADREVLLAALAPLGGDVPERPGEALHVLAAQAAGDHATGDVVDLDGWVLSRTECRAAALYAL